MRKYNKYILQQKKITMNSNKNIIKTITNDFYRSVQSFADMGVSDYEYSGNCLRVFVDFSLCMGEIYIEAIDVLTEEYETIDNSFSLELRNQIRSIIKDYNAYRSDLESRYEEEIEYRNSLVFS